MGKINYAETNKFWNESQRVKLASQYSMGYLLPPEFENVAYYRFRKELSFLNKFGKFGGNYLDLGCGTGNFIYFFRKRFDKLIGIDFSDSMVQTAKKRCVGVENVKIFRDNILNFEKYLENNDKFKFIFIGGCLIYLNDNDIAVTLDKLQNRLEKDGVIIFREPVATKKRIYENKDGYTGIRRTVREYKKYINADSKEYSLVVYPNYYVNYSFLIILYKKILFSIKLDTTIFYNPIVEFLFLYIPLRFYIMTKKNMVLYNFFVINKK